MGYESDEVVDKYGDQEELTLARALIDNVEGSYRVAIRQLIVSEANISHVRSLAAFEPRDGFYQAQAELHKRDDLFNQAIRDFSLLVDQYKRLTRDTSADREKSSIDEPEQCLKSYSRLFI